MMPSRRDLKPLPLTAVLPLGSHPDQIVITMGIGQWDTLLSEAYKQGWVLLELDAEERPVRAYQKGEA